MRNTTALFQALVFLVRWQDRITRLSTRMVRHKAIDLIRFLRTEFLTVLKRSDHLEISNLVAGNRHRHLIRERSQVTCAKFLEGFPVTENFNRGQLIQILVCDSSQAKLKIRVEFCCGQIQMDTLVPATIHLLKAINFSMPFLHLLSQTSPLPQKNP